MRRRSMPFRATHVAAAACVGATTAVAVVALVRADDMRDVAAVLPAVHARDASGVVALVDRTWHCRSHVDLTLVHVVIHDGASRDGVHLDRGCSGTIQRLEIVGNGGSLGPGGDGVKIHAGAHDLQVLGGVIDCGEKANGKHQDAIQAMGGQRVVFQAISSRYCSNSFMFINSGARHHGLPLGIRCVGCEATTRNYSIFVGHSLDSGATGGRFQSRVKPRATHRAVRPLLAGNDWSRRT